MRDIIEECVERKGKSLARCMCSVDEEFGNCSVYSDVGIDVVILTMILDMICVEMKLRQYVDNENISFK